MGYERLPEEDRRDLCFRLADAAERIGVGVAMAGIIMLATDDADVTVTIAGLPALTVAIILIGFGISLGSAALKSRYRPLPDKTTD